MPTETVIVVAGVALVVVVFATTPAWANHYTRDVRTPGAQYLDAPAKQ